MKMEISSYTVMYHISSVNGLVVIKARSHNIVAPALNRVNTVHVCTCMYYIDTMLLHVYTNVGSETSIAKGQPC